MTTPLTKQQAIEAMREGKKVRHETWAEGEWITLDKNNNNYYRDNNDEIQSVTMFWLYCGGVRSLTGWSIVED